MADLVKGNGRKPILEDRAVYTGQHAKTVPSETPGWVRFAEAQYTLRLSGTDKVDDHIARLSEDEMLTVVTEWLAMYQRNRKQEQHRCKQETSKTKSVS